MLEFPPLEPHNELPDELASRIWERFDVDVEELNPEVAATLYQPDLEAATAASNELAANVVSRLLDVAGLTRALELATARQMG